MYNSIRNTLLALLLLLAPSSLFAQTIYIWEDSQGRKHYTQLRPDEQISTTAKAQDGLIPPQEQSNDKQEAPKFKAMESSSAFLIDSSSHVRRKQLEQQQALREEQEKRLAEERKKRDTIAQIEETKRQNCTIAQENLAVLDQYLKGELSGLKYEDTDGNEVELSLEEIQTIHNRTVEEVDYFCN